MQVQNNHITIGQVRSMEDLDRLQSAIQRRESSLPRLWTFGACEASDNRALGKCLAYPERLKAMHIWMVSIDA